MTKFYWLELPVEVRAALAKTFGLVRSSGAVVEQLNGKMVVKSDGYSDKDLAGITVEKLQDFLKEKKEKDFWKLMEVAIEQVTSTSSLV